MSHRKRKFHHFGDTPEYDPVQFELARSEEPTPLDLPTQGAHTRRSQHIASVTEEQYLATLARKLITWVGDSTTADLHAITNDLGLNMVEYAHDNWERARRAFGEEDRHGSERGEGNLTIG